MKTFEILTFVGSFVFLIGIFCKVPKIFFDSELKNRFTKLMNSFGTAIMLIAPMFYIMSLSSYMSFEPEMAERPLSQDQRWMIFSLITLGFTLTYVMCIAMIRLVRNSLKSCSDTLANLATALTMEAIKKAGTKKGGTSYKDFFYNAGKEFNKGMNDNIPGDEWKKGGEDDDENPPKRSGFGRN